jgi:hypothetical protein
MRPSNYHHRPDKKHSMQRECHPKRRGTPIRSHDRELLGLKFHMLVFVAQDLIANCAQDFGLRGLAQRRIAGR